ncbi:hypothetical protein CON65_14720 [Bacillus pseudomycoides]|uniref:Uncharacterized protein n=1 Tax=Bacillus pseudomycoides TaxID=64104 RepID=A0AA91VC51_9BACI|nr:hypothetical protein COO03_24520 [Bacillus sp. AFS098217]PED81933.1 hypothetical protein CON65_14720 [Bacillus pseudomycoides]PEU11746.1 hypothetical protein CN525_21880 [Bacillus sp. AFS014408]PEU16459.1 hypothetical protein CN524_04390 [Bacillus sp. AFS019443]PFW62456.1 hypothetical protein COL20_13070 [Bacillus sp. AFS075034]
MVDSSFKCFYFRKIKTDVIDIYAHFVFMYLRSSSRELRDTPQNGGTKYKR